MVARTPLRDKRLAMALNPNLVRETIRKMDNCMARLQELQYTVTGGTKVISGVRLSPRSTKGYLRTSLRCKQESLRLKSAAAAQVRRSPTGKFQGNLNGALAGEWRRMSLPAMLLDETVGEILQVSQFAREIVAKRSSSKPTPPDDNPKTPDPIIRRQAKKPQPPPQHCDNTELRARRTKEKQSQNRSSLLCSPPPLPRARSHMITFKSSNSPLAKRRHDRSNSTRPVVVARRVSPKNKPWAKKAVLFPNPLFLPSSSSSSFPSSPSASHLNKFYKTRSPIITRRTLSTQQHSKTPHKFLIKSPPTSLRSQMKSKKAVPAPAPAPAPIVFSPVDQKKPASSRIRRCSFSPSRLATRLISPLRGRISLQASSSGLISGLKQRPNFNTPLKKKTKIPSIKMDM